MRKFRSFRSVLFVLVACFTLAIVTDSAFGQGRKRNTAPAAEAEAPADATADGDAQGQEKPGPAPQGINREAADALVNMAIRNWEVGLFTPGSSSNVKLQTLVQTQIANQPAGNSDWWTIRISAVLATLAFVGVVVLLMRVYDLKGLFGRSRRLGPAVLLAIGLGSVPAYSQGAAPVTPKLTCGDPTYNANFFPADGTAYDAVCTGVRGAKLEFDDPSITITDLKPTANGFTFKATVAKGADPGLVGAMVDGKEVATTFEVVDEATFDQRDAIITSLLQVVRKQGVGGSAAASASDAHARLVLEGLACPTADKTCLDNFRRAAWGNAKGSSTAAGGAVRTSIVDAAVSDPRLKTAMEAALRAFAEQMPSTNFDPQPVYDRLTTVENDVRAVGGRVNEVTGLVNQQNGRIVSAEERLVTVANATSATAQATRRLLDKKKPNNKEKESLSQAIQKALDSIK